MTSHFSKTGSPLYSEYIHKSRYARWLYDENRRETFEETVDRYVGFFEQRLPSIPKDVFESVRKEILSLSVMPSMRAMMAAGPALSDHHVAGYNCTAAAIDDVRVFDEILYILSCGAGVGFSVERQFICKLPTIPSKVVQCSDVIVVGDSKIGWAKGLRQLIKSLYSGNIPSWDMSKVRPKGAPLKTFGGRASGPGPLVDLFGFVVNTFRSAAGRKLSSLECHDIVCKIGEVIVCGGVRRSALISLSNPSDMRMRDAKSGEWWVANPQRGLANNSAVYTDKPDFAFFMKELSALYDSKSGERGFFSRPACRTQCEKTGRRDPNYEWLTNPCSEIILRPNQMCNLSEVVVRHDDTYDTLEAKVRIATIVGTMQSTLTDFKYLRKIWETNVAEERLLGVSLTGITDHPVLGDYTNTSLPDWLTKLKNVAIETNIKYASILGIPASTAITAVKPSGTVSQLVDSASGIHPRFSKYYIRRVRGSQNDPLASMMRDKGFLCEPDSYSSDNLVFSFPVKAPHTARTVSDFKCMEQLYLWKIYQDNWCEHKPSMTAYYTEDEFLEAGAWMWKHFDSVSGVSFLPYSEHSYVQAPYEEITEERYNEMVAALPTSVDWEDLSKYEMEDRTTSSRELACSAGVCESVDIV